MLYHYTDFAAFDGIIRCAELRLNNILNMNDAAEMRLFMNGICKAVYDKLESDEDTEKARKSRAFFKKELVKEFYYSAYAACFSKYRDDASQWERYGHYGQGVCIAFHEDMMEKMTGGAISLQEVYYQEDMREHRLVDDFVRQFTTDDTTNLSKLQTLMIEAWIQSAAFKHPSFASEKESRLVVSPFISNEFAVEPKYHVSDGRIKKYYPLNLNRMCSRLNMHLSDLVAEIIICPTSSQSLAILQDYLADCGLNVLKEKIHMSNCPLRKPTS
jgi:hypothetical protein